MTTVLISGAGVAGSTLAYWLARNGFTPTVVERSSGLRSSGNPVDVRGPALPVAEAMGVMPELRKLATQATGTAVLDASGSVRARAAMGAPGEVEIARTDLAAALYQAARNDAEFVFDDSASSLVGDSLGVDVTFERGAPRRFDYVIGADGLHSTVRRLAFGPEDEFVRHVGLYIATLPLGERTSSTDVLLYNVPRRLVALHPARGEAGVAFIFRGPAQPASAYRSLAQQKRIVRTVYRGVGWRVPEFLARVEAAEDLYFDAVSRVVVPRWSRGRIGLVGDAASCVSLLGDGSSLAMAGAFALAQALGSGGGFAAYQAEHQKLTGPKQRRVRIGAGLLVPKTAWGIATRNAAAPFLF
ncbi:FAD-dependent monooxygenase [Cryptosporangium phraense]|uniref:Monooxygenase n=1 Tax=Cryptosporangium phraense TaxID=2593070 RepID=A0A545AST1_9ACTN|nr:FAD-dependent monooxygenase [Cryptosporangium phraense]TQS43675.1 monooxygenase [Cryptosporangium phraense]